MDKIYIFVDCNLVNLDILFKKNRVLLCMYLCVIIEVVG